VTESSDIWCEKHVTHEGKPVCVVCGGIDWTLVPEPEPPPEPKPGAGSSAWWRRMPTPIEWVPASGPLGEWNPHIVHEESGFGPVGSITGWHPDAGPMEGAIPCDGRMLPIAEYPALAAVLGTTYGGGWSGEGKKVAFGVPDLRGSSMTGRLPPPRRRVPTAEEILDEMSKDEVKHLSFEEVMGREEKHLTYEDVMRDMREMRSTRVTRREYEGRWLE